MAIDRYLICAPRGGLNDNFCQIEQCWAYAERWNRKLYIDTAHSSLHGSMWEFFEEQPYQAEFAESVILHDADGAFWRSHSSTVRPAILSQTVWAGHDLGTKAKYMDVTGKRFGYFGHVETGERLSFDFHRDHPEDVLVHVSAGGGTASFALVNRIRIRTSVRDEILSRLSHLPQDYVSLHIRCTDMTSDYKAFLRARKDRLAGRDVLVCSDNQAVVDFATHCLSSSTVLSTASRRSRDGRRLHDLSKDDVDKDDNIAATLDALTDLVALARGVEIDVAQTFHAIKGSMKHRLKRNAMRALRWEKPTHQSGFSRLAQYLCSDKDVLGRFLNLHDAEIRRNSQPAATSSDDGQDTQHPHVIKADVIR